MNENQPLEPQKIPSRHEKKEEEIGSNEKWYKKIWNHPWFKKFREFWKKYHVTKLFLTIFLTFTAFFLVYLVYGAKTADVSGLRAGMIQETVIYDEAGQEAGALNISKAEYVPLNEISTYMKDAVLSTEDKRFYDHKGFDPIGILRAFAGVIIHRGNIVGGGSTLTQQLAKNAFLTLDQTLLRKAKELFLSFEIEKHYTKDQIFEMYLNNAYFGNGAYGIENAAQRYFGKSAANLSLSESAILAGALKAPSYYNPIDNYDATLKRRATVLSLMVNNGKISEQDANIAGESEISLVDNYVANSRYRYPYYFDAVINEIKRIYLIKGIAFIRG